MCVIFLILRNRIYPDKSIKRYNRKPISYKITKRQVDYVIKLLKQNEQITMLELSKKLRRNIKILMLRHNG